MALPNSNISVSMVRKELGASTNDVGQLCIHPNVNKWSARKPVRHSKLFDLTEQDYRDITYGLYPVTGSYNPPEGGASSPYRLDDFRGYNHLAMPPVWVAIDKIEGFGIPSGATPPYTLKAGRTYTITSRFVPGDIDPKYLDPTTVRDKNTSSGGGYGGLAWTYRPHTNVQIEVPETSVHSASTLSEPLHTFQFTPVPSGGSGERLRVEYVRYNGVINNKYLTVDREILAPNYTNLITVEPIYVSFGIQDQFTVIPLITGYRMLNTIIINDESFSVDIYVVAQYTNTNTSINYESTSAVITIPANSSGTYGLFQMSGQSVGTNNYTFNNIWLYCRNYLGDDFILDYAGGFSRTFTVVAPD